MTQLNPGTEDGIAIIGMAGRFPGAGTVEEYWDNLRSGKESIRFFTDEELAASGVDEAERRRPGYVPAKGVLDDIAAFDADYFGMSPREAALTDPQQRIFLENCVELLERAGVRPGPDNDRIGVFAGVSKDTYLFFNLLSHPELRRSPGAQQALVGNDKDYLASRVSFKLGLRGPSLTVQTACSTSLVAVHLATQSLLAGECDHAIAGGVALDVPHHAGYVYEPGGIMSPDGHCRAFDADARGTVFGQGVGAVLLRRLPDAVESGDAILAVIRGSAINNDGPSKVGFTAPSVQGQAAVVVEALSAAGVDPQTVSYVETHGTGTPVGDPIEIEALTRAYRLWTDRVGFCLVGSAKSNIGHLNSASGIAGLIKAVLALQHGEIPPSLHFERPNPAIAFAQSPFRVCAELTPWPQTGGPRRAGVSSFGIGGTNAHVILEQAPAQAPGEAAAAEAAAADDPQIVVVSARSQAALSTATARLATALAQRPELAIGDVAYTLQLGRQSWPYRTAVVARNTAEAATLLRGVETTPAGPPASKQPLVAFLFPGQGVPLAGAGRQLHHSEPVFREELDACAARLRALGVADPMEILLAEPAASGAARPAPIPTQIVQPALFAFEYALARLWMSWDVIPDAVLGHSLGEIVAATVAGVLDRDSALALVAERARRIGEQSGGAMLAVGCGAEALPTGLPAEVEIAAYNAARQVVLTGPTGAVRAAEELLRSRKIPATRLPTSHAFHSALLDPAVAPVTACAADQPLKPPSTPCLSNVSGGWLTAETATDPRYWGRQLREPVRFADCLETLLASPERILLEVGPGRTLGRLACQHPRWSKAHRLVWSMPVTAGEQPAAVLDGLAKLWSYGVEPAWRVRHAGRRRRPVVLPTYPFERRRHWIDPLTPASDAAEAASGAGPAAGRTGPASGSGIERAIADVFSALLGVGEVAVTDDFFELGGHSMLGVELAARLRDALGTELPLTAILDTPTPVKIAALVRRASADGVDTAVAELRADPLEDIWFDAVPAQPMRPRAGRPRSVLLTGATGFLGGFLLRELLERTEAEVNVVVRACDPAAGRDRVLAGLRRYDLLEGADLSRLRVEVGDLSAERLGLSDDVYRGLAGRLDAIYHNGARVSFLEPYRMIRRTNVESTREVLRLACHGRAKTVHYVSSIAALDCDAFADLTVAPEDVDLRLGGGFHGGYDEAKWVSERIIALAREQGVAAAVYRPGNIAGHSRTGAVSQGHLVSAMIKGCVHLGCAPDLDSYVDIVPVDYVSRALVHISLSDEAVRRPAHHLVNTTAVRWSTIVEGLRGIGYPLRTMPIAQWREEIRRDTDQGNAMRVFLPMLDERALFSGRRYRSDNTAAALARSGITCPPLDTALLTTYVRRLVATGELPAPR